MSDDQHEVHLTPLTSEDGRLVWAVANLAPNGDLLLIPYLDTGLPDVAKAVMFERSSGSIYGAAGVHAGNDTVHLGANHIGFVAGAGGDSLIEWDAASDGLTIGSAAAQKLGFFATPPVVQQTLVEAGCTAAQLYDVLEAYGLVTAP